ncbi:MAG: flagellar biosynthetic protein FliO [Butyrivibrio sp.]|nr:flagellar biosynthetic protein FliO [Butyrivibrio sp.]
MMDASSVAQMITVLIIFVAVLALTYYVTKWIAKYQQVSNSGNNMEIMETMRISANKYLQIVRVSDKYLVLCVCKDTVTLLCELDEGKYIPPVKENAKAPDFSKELEKFSKRFMKK